MCVYLTTLSVLVPFTELVVLVVLVVGGEVMVAGEGGGVSDDEGGGVLRYFFLTVSDSLEFPVESRAVARDNQLASSVTFNHNCTQTHML